MNYNSFGELVVSFAVLNNIFKVFFFFLTIKLLCRKVFDNFGRPGPSIKYVVRNISAIFRVDVFEINKYAILN